MNSKCKASENISRLYSVSDSEDGDKTKKGEYKSRMQIFFTKLFYANAA